MLEFHVRINVFVVIYASVIVLNVRLVSIDLGMVLSLTSQKPLTLCELPGNDTIWHHKSWSTFFEIMALCLTAPNHYLDLFRLSHLGPMHHEGFSLEIDTIVLMKMHLKMSPAKYQPFCWGLNHVLNEAMMVRSEVFTSALMRELTHWDLVTWKNIWNRWVRARTT